MSRRRGDEEEITVNEDVSNKSGINGIKNIINLLVV